MSKVRSLIETNDDLTLIGLVMQLTGGSANPNVVQAQIKNWRERYISGERNDGREVPHSGALSGDSEDDTPR